MSVRRSILVVAGDSQVRGHDRETGRLVWEHVVTGSLLGITVRFGGAIELAIHDGRVLAAMRDRIVCLDYETGAKLGEVMLGSPSMRPTFLIDEGRIFVASGKTLECFTLEGQRLWSTPRAVDRDGAALGFPGNVRQGDGLVSTT